MKIYPYVPGGVGNSIGAYLTGRGRSAAGSPQTPFRRGHRIAHQHNPAERLRTLRDARCAGPAGAGEALDTELAGQFAAIGIVKGEKFAPDTRLRGILDEAVAVGNAASRTLGMGAHPTEGFRYYDGDSAWWNMLFVGGFEFTNPPPMITADGIQPFPNKGARQLHSRTGFLYTATGITPAMCMRLTNVGSQYLIANVDTAGEPLDGAKTYRLRLPKDIPAARFWSLTVYDNQTRSMLQTEQRYPRAGSQSYPSPAAEPEPTAPPWSTSRPPSPTASPPGNWIQTDPDKGWFVVLRLYSPLQSFFDKTWRPGRSSSAR